MSVHTHGIDVAAVLARYPTQDTTTITSTSRGINTVLIEALIIEGAGALNAILRRHNISPEGLDADAVELLRGAIIAYVIAECMDKLGKAEPGVSWRAKYDAVRRTLRDWPEDLGDAQRAEDAVPVSPDDDEGPRKTPWDQW